MILHTFPGKTEELEQYLQKQLRANPLDPETQRALIQLLAGRRNDDALYFCSKINPVLYLELDLLQLCFSVVAR